jgi:hypothetical protein
LLLLHVCMVQQALAAGTALSSRQRTSEVPESCVAILCNALLSGQGAAQNTCGRLTSVTACYEQNSVTNRSVRVHWLCVAVRVILTTLV